MTEDLRRTIRAVIAIPLGASNVSTLPGRSSISPENAQAPRDLSAIERAVLAAYEAQREPIGDSDLDNEQPVSLTVRTTLGELRRLHMQGFAQAARS